MQNVNASAQAAADKALAKAQQAHQVTTSVLGYCSSKDLAVGFMCASGYCADATVELDICDKPFSLDKLLSDVFPPLPVVHVASKGSSSTIKPAMSLRDNERTNQNVVPAFPVFSKASSRGNDLRWWSKISSGEVVEVAVKGDPASKQYEQLLAGRNLEAVPCTYTTGATLHYNCGFAPVAGARTLPILALDKAWDVSDNVVRNLMKRHTSVLLNEAWNWRSIGVDAAQHKLDAVMANLNFAHGMLTAEQNAESKVFHQELVSSYLRLAQETDVLLNQCKEVLTELFTTKGAPEDTVTGCAYLKRYLAEKLNIEVPHLELARNRRKVRCSLATKSRALYAPIEFVVDIDADKTALRFQDMEVTYDKEALVV